VVGASLSVPSARHETKVNRKKHESSLLTVFSDAGSTPAASTIYKQFHKDKACGRTKNSRLLFQSAGNSFETFERVFCFLSIEIY